MARSAPPMTLVDGNVLECWHSLCGRLDPYRNYADLFEARKGVLSFVTGLRFSALLIYAIRRILSDVDLTASWGVIVKHGNELSPECDIVVHRAPPAFSWNGGDDQRTGSVMDFSFVSSTDAVTVISCKTYVSSVSEEMEDYVVRLRPFVPRVWLFYEYAKSTKEARSLRKAAREAGYARFCYLYLVPDGSGGVIKRDDPELLRFSEALRGLA